VRNRAAVLGLFVAWLSSAACHQAPVSEAICLRLSEPGWSRPPRRHFRYICSCSIPMETCSNRTPMREIPAFSGTASAIFYDADGQRIRSCDAAHAPRLRKVTHLTVDLLAPQQNRTQREGALAAPG
jgi:hypothetical protein